MPVTVDEQIAECQRLKQLLVATKRRHNSKLWHLFNTQPHLPWNWAELVGRSDVKIAYLIGHARVGICDVRFWNIITAHSATPVGLIAYTLGKSGYNWQIDFIANNPNLTVDFVRQHLGLLVGTKLRNRLPKEVADKLFNKSAADGLTAITLYLLFDVVITIVCYCSLSLCL